MATLRGKQLKQVIDPTLAKAFTHPLRGHVWVTLFERGTASPKEIADELELDVSEVSYHFRGLKKRKLIKLVRTESRRGFAEHFYEPISPALFFDDSDWMQIPAGIRSTLSGEMLRQIIEELVGALEAGSFDARSRHLSQTWVLADEEGWSELMQVAEEALEQVLTIQKRCAERCRKASEPGIPVSFLVASFETAGSISQRQPAPGQE
ncbi:MAG TPA: helix-turn-helix domain-containing protein [Solirubrobacterales bacterium]|nr:helix-turn-helix domain-containing protein [Solirubrobacterales bacterium]